MQRVLAYYLFSELVSMSTVGIHVADRLRCSTITEEVEKLMDTFGVADVEVPEHICIRKMSCRVSLMRTVQGRELNRIANEKDRRVVEDPVQVTLIRVDLHGPSVNIASGICRTGFRSNCRYSKKDGRLLASFAQEAS